MVNENLRSMLLGGGLKDYKKHMAGNCRGFYIVLEPGTGRYRITVNAWKESDLENKQVHEILRQQQMQKREILDVRTGAHFVTVEILLPTLAKNIAEAVNGVINPLLDYLMAEGYKSGCQECGTDITMADQYDINETYHFLCSGCVNRIGQAMDARHKEGSAQKSNLAMGIIGALIGALIGAALWILIGKLGYIAGIAGAVTAICAMKGYEMLGKTLDRKGLVSCIIIMVVMIFAANYIGWTWEAYEALSPYGYTFGDAFVYLFDILKDSDLTGYFFKDLIIGYVLTAICTVGNFVRNFKATGRGKIKRVN